MPEMTNREAATKIAASIKKAIEEKTGPKLSGSTIRVSYPLHIALEATAAALEVDKTWFKIECGVGQPLAYFV